MKSILEQLYHGEIAPASEYKAPTPKTKSSYEITRIKKDNLLEKLSEELKQDFLNLMDSYYRLSDLENEESFLDGFRLGVKMTTEIYSQK